MRAGNKLNVAGRNLPGKWVRIILGGRDLGAVRVEEGTFRVRRTVPKAMAGTFRLRVVNRDGDALATTKVKVLRAKRR